MAINLRCTGCRSTLKLRDDLAGKKVKCPRCQAVLSVPQAVEELVEVAADTEHVPENARPKTGRTGRVQREEPAASRKEKIRIGRDEDDSREVPTKKTASKASKYKPCPQCGAEGAKRVKWTSWGSFYGPALFTHVSCPECAYCYNGKTGRSNLLAATMFVMVPLLGILGILGGIAYIVIQRGHASF